MVLSIITAVLLIINGAVMLQTRTWYTRRIVAKLVWLAGYIFQRMWNNDGTGCSNRRWLAGAEPAGAWRPDSPLRLGRESPVRPSFVPRASPRPARMRLSLQAENQRRHIRWPKRTASRSLGLATESIRICGAVTPRPAQRQHRCRWQGRDTSDRREAAAYRRGRWFASATADAPRAGSIASVDAWQNVC
jgi:hypothetical protein